MRTLKNIYRTHIDVIGYKKTEAKRYENDNEAANDPNQDQEMLNEDGIDLDQMPNEENEEGLGDERPTNLFTKDQVKKFKEFAANPHVYDLLIDALAPSIWECHDVKKGILC